MTTGAAMNARIAVFVAAVLAYAVIAHIASTATQLPALAWIFWVQDSALNIGLALLFGVSLRRGAVPLCTRIALSLQQRISARALRYTHAVTWAWTLFFSAMVAVSALLFFGGARATWSLFANVLYWPLLVAMFVLEYALRIAVLPRADRAGFFATINAFSHFHRAHRKRAAS